MTTNAIRLAAAIALLLWGVASASNANAAAGETALSKCVDAVVAACNKKKDAGVNPCIDNGISQCEKQHRAQLPSQSKPPAGNQHQRMPNR